MKFESRRRKWSSENHSWLNKWSGHGRTGVMRKADYKHLLSINIEALVFFCQNLSIYIFIYIYIYYYIFVSNSTMSISAGILEKVKSKIHSIAG